MDSVSSSISLLARIGPYDMFTTLINTLSEKKRVQKMPLEHRTTPVGSPSPAARTGG